MKAYKIEILVIDYDGIGAEAIKYELENSRYSNRCISPEVMKTVEADIGEWDDLHPLNQLSCRKEHYNAIFS